MRHKGYRKKRLLKKLMIVFWGSVIIGISVFIASYLWQMDLKIASSDVEVCFQEETLVLTWKPSIQLDACRLYKYSERAKEFLFYGEYTGQTIILNDITMKEPLKLRLKTVNYIKMFNDIISVSGFTRELTIMPTEFENIVLDVSANKTNRMVYINWNATAGNSYEVYLFDEYGRQQVYTQTIKNVVVLDFNHEFPLPDKDHPVKVAVRAIYYEKDYTLYSSMSDIISIGRGDLLEDELYLKWEQIGERQYRLKWQVCRGEWYEVQQWREDGKYWVSKEVFHRTEDMSYQTERLPSSREVCFRVISYNNIKKRDQEEYETEPSQVTFRTDMSPLYCTIWPIMSLDILNDPKLQKVLGKVPAGQTLCVLEENGGYFKIFYKDCIGFVDSSFCMINLPEYIGDLCEYNITSSIHSMSCVHGYDIPGITGTVIRGYENIYLGKNSYLVPYLYPCTKKLYAAIINAARDGYRFRIYDAFRPNEATRYYYDTAESMMDHLITSEDGNSSITLRELMTGNGKYRLSSFLAASVSAHNRGIALDLTLIDLETNEELKMQTDIHDLSAYSAIVQNNDNACLLAKYMKEVGYNDLFSEWWHFQDDETKEKIGLKSYLWDGVSFEGWKKDDIGWRYQLKDGSFYKDTMEIVDGKNYIFDVEGYCVLN